MHKKTRATLVAAGLVATVSTTLLVAGPLTPPPGAPASTYKTLQQVEPRTPISGFTDITAPGSYYLTQSFGVVAGTDAILVRASNVTIDLNGFTISGGRTGVALAGGVRSVVIKNGMIRNMTGSAIFADAGSGPRATQVDLRDLRLADFTDAAVFLGDDATISNVVAQGVAGSTSSSGFTVGARSNISSSSVDRVALTGISAGPATQVSSVSVSSTGGDGILVTSHSRVADTIVTSAAGNGMRVTPNTASNVTIDRCTIDNVGLNGIQLDGNSSLVTNTSVSSIGGSSTFGGPISSGVLMNGSDSRVESNRFFRCGFPVFITGPAKFSSVLRNAANFCLNSYTNTGDATNLIAPVASSVLPTGPYDNTRQ